MMILRFPLVLSFVVIVVPLLAQAPADALDRVVSRAKQQVLGLDKLSPEQRAGLAKLLNETYQLGVATKEKQVEAARRVAPSVAPAAQVIESKIEGEFEGWSGETVIKLINGHIYQQVEYYYFYRYAFMPNVIIYNSELGLRMKVDGVDRPVAVRRLR